MDLGIVRFAFTINKIMIPLFSVLLWEAMLNKFFNSRCSSLCGMVVYKVEKSNGLMMLQTYLDLQNNIHHDSLLDEFIVISIC